MTTVGRKVAVLFAVGMVGCSSDSTPSSTGTGATTSTTATTSAGTGAAQNNACKVTNCRDDLAIGDDACNSILATPCADKARAWYACSLANDVCEADGTQDGSRALTACATQVDAMLDCLSGGDAGTD